MDNLRHLSRKLKSVHDLRDKWRSGTLFALCLLMKQLLHWKTWAFLFLLPWLLTLFLAGSRKEAVRAIPAARVGTLLTVHRETEP